MSTKGWIILALLALLLLFILCPWMHWQEIAALQKGGGIATNTNTNNANVALAAPSLKVAFENGKYRLTGTLPDEATKQKVLAKAKEVYGEGNFIDELKVGGVSAPSWSTCVIALMPFTKNGITNGGLSVEGEDLIIITLSGEVPTQAEKEKILDEALSERCPNMTIEDSLTVAGQKTLSDEQAKVQGKLNKALAGKIVEFATNSDQLTDKGKAVLDELAPIIKDSTDKLEIGGHTDNAGKSASNQALSQRRAETVKKYLVGKGLDANRFTAKGYGQDKPVADNNTEEGKQRNRRIGFEVTGGGK